MNTTIIFAIAVAIVGFCVFKKLLKLALTLGVIILIVIFLQASGVMPL